MTGAAVIVGLVTFWALSRRRRQSGQLASVTSIGPPADAASAQKPESQERSRRRAA